MKKIIVLLAMATSISAYAQNSAEKFRVEVTEQQHGQSIKNYIVEGNVDSDKPFVLGDISKQAKSAFNFSIKHSKNQYNVEVKDLSTAGSSLFQDDDSFVSQKINLSKQKSQEIVVSDQLKFKITLI